MSDIASIASAASRLDSARFARDEASTRPATEETSPVRRDEDRVELSPVGTYLAKLRNLPIRSELVSSVREQIAQGTYDTPEKIDAAIEELLKDL